MQAADERARHRTDHLERNGGCDRHWRCVLERPRLRRLARPGAKANLDRRPHHPRQDIKARQSLSARAVRSSSLGGAGQDWAEALAALWARDLDRGAQQAPASRRAGDRAREQARPARCRTCCLRANRNSRPLRYLTSWLNPTPHAIAVYASQPLSPVARHGLDALVEPMPISAEVLD